MAEASGDPRETADHPRLVKELIGHAAARAHIRQAIDHAKLHHAWIVSGASGIGKATLAYTFAKYLLAKPTERLSAPNSLSIDPEGSTARWIAGRAHPDLFVLERQWDSKTKKLKSELSVEDARHLSSFFGKTAGGDGWRVAIVDAADDLNIGSANALLKLMEEPPPKSLLLLVTNRPGQLLTTIKSRCTQLDLSPLTEHETRQVIMGLETVTLPEAETLDHALHLSGGSPGRALQLLNAQGAQAFMAFQTLKNLNSNSIVEFANRYAGRSMGSDDFNLFFELLQDWMTKKVRNLVTSPENTRKSSSLAEAYDAISHSLRLTNSLNLDRRQAVVNALMLINHAMKTT